MLRKTVRFTKQARACRLSICAFLWMGALAAGCSSDGRSPDEAPGPSTADDDDDESGATDDADGQKPSRVDAGTPKKDAGPSDAGSSSNGGSRDGGGAARDAASDGADAAQGGSDAGVIFVEAKCGANDKPEKGLQGDINSGTVNCGLTLLSELPSGGSVQGSGHCAYVRSGSSIKAYSLADPLKPVQTDEVPTVGSTESMRAHTVEGRAILVSGRGVYDISNCEKMVKKGEIAWPSANAMLGFYVGALSSHEIGISHDAKRVYSGLGFNIAFIDDLEKSASWTVKNWSCEMNKQSGFPTDVPNACEGPSHQDVGRQYSHSSDDNLEGTVWYGANQEGSSSQMERSTARMVDISNPASIKILDTVVNFPGHSMNWWRTPDGRDFIIGANEALSRADSCVAYPRPVNLGNAYEAYVAEVTGNKFGKPFILTLDINKPENCQAANTSRSNASITEHSVYNKGGAAFVMIEFGTAGLRVFDLRNGDKPREVAYYNDNKGHAHSGVFSYDEASGIMVASGRTNGHVLMLQPQMIAALGLPTPTDPKYPYE